MVSQSSFLMGRLKDLDCTSVEAITKLKTQSADRLCLRCNEEEVSCYFVVFGDLITLKSAYF